MDQSWVSTLKLREACPPHSSLSVPAYDRPHADGHFEWPRFCVSVREMTSAWTLRPSWLAFSLFSRVWKSLTQLDWLLRPYHGPFVFMSWPHIWAFGLNLVKMKIWQLLKTPHVWVISVFKPAVRRPLTPSGLQMCWFCHRVALSGH